LRNAITINPENIEGWKALGNLYMLRDDFNGAKDAFEKIVRTGKADWVTWHMIGKAHFRTGNLNDAMEAYEKAMKLESRTPEIYIGMAEIYTATENFVAAIDCYTKVVELNPDYKEGLQNRAFLLEKLGRYEEAVADYDRLIGLDPENKYVWNSKGLCLIKMERYEDALRCFEKALEIDKEFAPAFEGRKTAQMRLIEKNIETYARKVLEYEYQVKRKVTKRDMFVDCKIPFNLLDHVATYVSRIENVEISALSKLELETIDRESTEVLKLCLQKNPDGITRNGIMLSDIVVNAPDISVQKAKRILGFIKAVESMEVSGEITPELENLAREAMKIPPEQRTLFNLAKELNIGIYKARFLLHALKSFTDGKVSTPKVEVEEIIENPEGAHPNSDYIPIGRKGMERCMICNGLADIVHECGAPVCFLCAKTYGTCPRCGRQIVLPTPEAKGSENVEKKGARSHEKQEDAGTSGQKPPQHTLPAQPQVQKKTEKKERDIGQL
ncbi:MAG: tetratricopeptide repeat protein, partial [Thermoplasmata archaeon]